MDKNLIVPTLFILGFAAVLALTVLPAADDGVQTYEAMQGETLRFMYLDELGLGQIAITSDDGVGISQEPTVIETKEGLGTPAFKVSLNLLKPGSHTISVGEGARSESFQVDVFLKVKATPSGDHTSPDVLYFIAPELDILSVVGGEGDDDMFGDDEGLWLTPVDKKELRHH